MADEDIFTQSAEDSAAAAAASASAAAQSSLNAANSAATAVGAQLGVEANANAAATSATNAALSASAAAASAADAGPLRAELAAPTGFNLIGGRKKFLILATGQSNIQQEPAYSWTPPPNIFVWEWPGLNSTGTRFIPCPSDKINHSYAAAAELARLNPTWQVYVVRIASGGRPIEHWLPGGSDATSPTWNAYADCKNNVERALSVLSLDKIDYLQWHQGESNIDDGSLYIAKWNNVFARFVAESWFDSNTSTLINGITSQAIKGDVRYKTQNLMLKQIVTARPWQRAFIPTAEIVPADLWLSDGLHMSGEGHDLLGRSEADMICRGIATQVTRGQIFSNEDANVCIGGAIPAAGGTLEVNKGSNLDGSSKNSRTSLDVINTQTGTADIASSRVIGANGVFSVSSYGSGALTNTVRLEWTGSSQIQMAATSAGALTFFAGSTEILRAASGILRPGTTDNVMSLGAAGTRFSQVFAATGTINTSDERLKTRDVILDAEKAAALEIKANVWKYKFSESVEEKGSSARIHFGVGAQTVGAILRKHGLDPNTYAFFCHDEWEEEREPVLATRTVESESGETIEEEYDTGETRVTLEAGDRYGVRYEELLCFIMAAL